MNNATVLAFCSCKGGCAKSTSCLNFGAGYLAHHNKKVLIIDLDYQHNITDSLISNLNHDPLKDYQPNIKVKNQIKNKSVYNIFKHQAVNSQKPYSKDFKPIHIDNNVDLIPATDNLDQIENLFRNKMTLAPYALSTSFINLKLPTKYDYILIDCHNSFTLTVQNALVCADYIISPVIPSGYSLSTASMMIHKISQIRRLLMNPMTQKSFMTAKLLFIGAMIKHNTHNSQQFLKYTINNPAFVALLPDRELFNRATSSNIYDLSMAEAKKKHNYRDLNTVKKQIDPEYNKLYEAINQKED